jgi:hypothetical protein
MAEFDEEDGSGASEDLNAGLPLDPRLLWLICYLSAPLFGYLLSLANLSTEHIAGILIIG